MPVGGSDFQFNKPQQSPVMLLNEISSLRSSASSMQATISSLSSLVSSQVSTYVTALSQLYLHTCASHRGGGTGMWAVPGN